GYKVVNLGIKQPIENIISAAVENKADCIGMSGLLVKSTVIMKENLDVLNQRGISMPVILGGAALTRRYVEEDCRRTYDGLLFYGQDAFDDLRIMEALAQLKQENGNGKLSSLDEAGLIAAVHGIVPSVHRGEEEDEVPDAANEDEPDSSRGAASELKG